MTATTVSQFAVELKMPVAALLEQLGKAGVGKQSSTDALTDQDKSQLLEALQQGVDCAGRQPRGRCDGGRGEFSFRRPCDLGHEREHVVAPEGKLRKLLALFARHGLHRLIFA